MILYLMMIGKLAKNHINNKFILINITNFMQQLCLIIKVDGIKLKNLKDTVN